MMAERIEARGAASVRRGGALVGTRVKALLAMLVMVSAATASHMWKPTIYMAAVRPKLDLEQLFPARFAGWTVDNSMPAQLVSPDTQALLNKIYSQVLSRTYTNAKGDRIMLSVAYGGDQSEATRAHRPEVCYPAQGFEVLDTAVAQVDTPTHPIRVRHLVARLNARVEPITYWVVVGDYITLSGTEQKWRQMNYGFEGVIPDGMLVRVSNISDNALVAYALQASFIADMAAALKPDLRSRVIGSTGS